MVTTRQLVESAQEILKLRFDNEMLLTLALTHRSFAHESLPSHHLNNEKLEFLGDSVLNFVITGTIFDGYNELAEGDLAKLRANLVNADILAHLAHKIGLGDCILLGKGAERTGGRERTSILSDTFEAIVGAMYLDRGFEAAREFILKSYGEIIDEQANVDQLSDYKSALQEKTAKDLGIAPVYRIAREEGPDHDRTFFSEIVINDEVLSVGSGKSKKKAEQEAAKEALRIMTEREQAAKPAL